MNLSEGLAQLRRLQVPTIRTNDAAALWGESRATASTMLARLAKVGHIQRIVRGLWLVDTSINPWYIHPYLTDPAPSYISLTTALFHHGMIEQIPTTVHVITTIKPRMIKGAGATFSLHQVAPPFFCGFAPLGGGPAQMALPEKALVDFLYFRPTRSRAFRALPELELPTRFSRKRAYAFVDLIGSESRKRMVMVLLQELLR